MEYVLVVVLFALVALLPRRRSRSRDVPNGFYDYLSYSLDAEGRRWDEQLAENRRRYDECKRKEEDAWREHYWQFYVLCAWADLFMMVHGIMIPYPAEELKFRRSRAILISGDGSQPFWPDLPLGTPSTPQEMWERWEKRFLPAPTL